MADRTWQPVILGDVAFIPLSQGEWAIVDTDSVPLLEGHAWHVIRPCPNQTYASGHSVATGHRYMHRVVMGCRQGDGMQVDHINGNGLDNRRANLRDGSGPLNRANERLRRGGTSQYKGVSWSKVAGKWRAYIKADRKQIHLGLFEDETEAARAYDAKAVELWGEFAYPNFPAQSRMASAARTDADPSPTV